MKTCITLILCFFIIHTSAQQPTEIPSPNTETAYLNYDFNLQRSGYEQVETKMIYSYLNQPLRLYFVIDSLYDYMFAAICDSSTGGLKAECYYESDASPFIQSDPGELIKEYNAKITLLPLSANQRNGTVSIILNLQGKTEAIEPSYYMMVRKKRIY